MMLPTALAQELGNQHRNDMLAGACRWRTRRAGRLARLAQLTALRQAARKAARSLDTVVPAQTLGTVASAAAAPERAAIEVRRPLVRS